MARPFAFGYAFLPLLGAIVVLAAGVKRAILSYGAPASATTAWFLAAGVAGYVAALAVLRLVPRTGPVVPRLVLAGLVLATVVAGRKASPEVQLCALSLLLCGGVVVEAILYRRQRTAEQAT